MSLSYVPLTINETYVELEIQGWTLIFKWIKDHIMFSFFKDINSIIWINSTDSMIICMCYNQVEHEYEFLNEIALFSVDHEKAVWKLCWFIAVYIFAHLYSTYITPRVFLPAKHEHVDGN